MIIPITSKIFVFPSPLTSEAQSSKSDEGNPELTIILTTRTISSTFKIPSALTSATPQL